MSQKKRLMEKRRKEEAAKKAAQARKNMIIIGIASLVIVIAVIAGALIFDANRKNENEMDYSTGLSADGKIKGVNVNNYVELCNFNRLNRNIEDYYPTEDEEKQYIDAITSSYPELDKKTGVEVKDGDMLDIDYVGTIDGKEYEGGNTNGNGIKIILGNDDYPEGFEDGILGHKTGETFNIAVPYADDFGNEELAGRSVDYEITINGIYTEAEFNDAFVEKNFGSTVENAEDFVEKYRKSFAETEFDKEVQSFIISDSNVSSYPASYIKKMRAFMKAKDYKQMETTNSTYQSIYGYDVYKDVLEMRGMSKSEYKEAVDKDAKAEVKKNMIYQALFEKYGLSVTQEDLQNVSSSYGFGEDEYDKAVERFGDPYIHQQAMIKVVNNYLTEHYNLSD
ncbi:MAG: FKBP-type peptidyl-prolyl cis-trans isomerase [Lachnospiraceae bacterium]|nr:FKBP-type peptidyl-prolyl cis-trans isomerase [Lachnospiraceae bacterium]